MNWLHRKLLRNSHYYREFIKWTKSIVLPGFGTLSVYEIIATFVNEFLRGSLLNKASSLAYNFMLAFFPATIFLFTLIPYVPVKNFQPTLLKTLAQVLPTNAYLAFDNTIKDIVSIHHGKLLSVGFITTLYFATNGISNLMQAFNRSSLIIEKRTWLKRRMVALVLTVVISLSLLIAIAIMVEGQTLIEILKSHLLSKSAFWGYLLTVARWLIIISIFFVTVSILYRYGPAHKLRWPFLNPGSILATSLAILSSWGFTFYINHFSSYNKLYGSLGTLIVVMIWLWLNSLILLIGFELNANIDLSKRSIKVVKPRFNTFRVNKYGE